MNLKYKLNMKFVTHVFLKSDEHTDKENLPCLGYLSLKSSSEDYISFKMTSFCQIKSLHLNKRETRQKLMALVIQTSRFYVLQVLSDL